MIKEFLKKFYKVKENGRIEVKPAIVCNDNFWISVQANESLFCFPQENLPSGEYESVEVYISDQSEERLDIYSDGNFCKYVPVEVLEEVILSHGGISHLLTAENEKIYL